GCPVRLGFEPEETELGLRFSAAHDVGKSSTRAARKGPPERAVPGVEKKVGVLRTPNEAKIAGGGRSQSRPELSALRTPRVREPFEAALDERRTAGLVHLGVVAVQLRGACHAQAIAQSRDHDLARVIGQARVWGFVTRLVGQSNRIALHRVNRYRSADRL